MRPAIGLFLWLSCGITAAGLFNGMNDHFNWGQEKCEVWSARDQSFGLIWGVAGGPLSLVVALAFTGFGHDGWTILRKPCINGQM